MLRKYADYLAIAAITILYFASCRYFQHAGADDIFISFRYARNLAEGYGLVFNPGERVEGFSNFLWVLILSGASALGLVLPIFSKFLSVFFGAASIWMVWIIARKSFGHDSFVKRVNAVFVTFFFSVSHIFVYWSVTGMETSLYVFLILLVIVLQVRDYRSVSLFPISSIAFVLLAMCRVEGIVFYFISIIPKILSIRADKNIKLIKKYVLEGGIVLFVFVCILIARHIYYGEWISNTYQAKVGGSQWHTGWLYLYEFLKAYYFLILLAAAGMYLVWKEDRFLSGLIICYFSGYTFLIVFIGGDWMWHFRFFVPLLPLLWIAGGKTTERLLYWIDSFGVRIRYKIAGYFLLLFVLFFPLKNTLVKYGDWKGVFSMQVKDASFCIETLIVEAHKELAEYLLDKIDEKSVIAANHIGALGYYSRFRILDMVGLINPDIALLKDSKFHEKHDSNAILKRQPDYVILTTRTRPEKNFFVSDYWIGETDLYNQPEFQKLYIQQDKTWSYTYAGNPEYLVIFERQNISKNP